MRKEFECEICKFKSFYKGDLKKHIKTKKHLSKLEELRCIEEKLLEMVKIQHNPAQILENFEKFQHKTAQISKSEEIFNCEHCLRNFKSQDNLIRHTKKYCKVKKQLDEELEHVKIILEEERASHKEEKKRLYDCIDKLIQKAGNITTTITNNTQNNISLNSYGSEDLSHITDKLKREFLQLPYGMIPKMIEKVHFSGTKPENSNIALTNKKENFIKIFKEGKWQYCNKEEILNDLIQTNYCRLDEFYEDICEGKLPDIYNIRYKKFQEKFDNDDQNLKEQIKQDSILILMNENLKI